MCITIGNGSATSSARGCAWRTGSAILAEEVAQGLLEVAFVNPSAMLTQAYRGVGLFRTALPLRVVASIRAGSLRLHRSPERGFRSLKDIKAKQYPLHVSVSEDPTHSTRVLIQQAFARTASASRTSRPGAGASHLRQIVDRAALSRWRAARSTRYSTRASRSGSTRR